MQIPTQVSFLGIPVSDAVEAACLREAAKLERYHDRVTGCRITVGREACRHLKGTHWSIHVRLTVPGGELVVSRDPPEHAADEKIELALRETFDRVRRRLQDHARRQGARGKRHAEPEVGRVVRLEPLAGYAFLAAPDGTELYLHRNALVEGGFDDLALGTEVRYVAEVGDDGPQATSARVVGHRHEVAP